jgi:amidase
VAHATDGGGSIRIPASWCGLVGLNPSRGRISTGPSLQDSIFGLAREFVVCRSVRDMAHTLDALAGPAAGDPFIVKQPPRPYGDELSQPTPKARIDVAVTAWGKTEMDAEVRTALEKTVALLADMGHDLIEIEAPVDSDLVLHAVMGGFVLAMVELEGAAKAMGRKIDADTVEPVSLKLYRKVMGESAAWAASVLEAIRKLRYQVGRATAAYDFILTPTMPNAALPHGTFSTTRDDLSAEEYMEGDISVFQYLGVFNVTGQPSVTLPLWENEDGLPIGMQLAARFGEEGALVRISRDLEEACPWSDRRPAIHAATV